VPRKKKKKETKEVKVEPTSKEKLLERLTYLMETLSQISPNVHPLTKLSIEQQIEDLRKELKDEVKGI